MDCDVLMMVKAGLKVMACGVPLVAARLADYCRVTNDSGLPWSKNLLLSFLNTTVVNIVFIDSFCLPKKCKGGQAADLSERF